MATRINLIRHGETEWSLTGRTDVPLTANGERRAAQFHGVLQSFKFTQVLTSLLQRARRTCELAGFGAVARMEPDLQEWDYGDYDGRRYPKLGQVACFDTAFHHAMPRVATLLPIPRRYEAAGVRRYGFHGLSYEFLMGKLGHRGDAAATMGRVILAHLGNGASLAAVRDGRSIDTSMGFTLTAGLIMSTRTGDLDPGLIYFLARTERMSAKKFQGMVTKESGLLGVSEVSSDVRELLAGESDDVRAAEAVALFCYQAKKWIGSFAAALGGPETLVFAGGIGENAPIIRERICDGLDFLGIKLNRRRNAKNASLISTDAGRVAVRVIRTDEELMIARSVMRVPGSGAWGRARVAGRPA